MTPQSEVFWVGSSSSFLFFFTLTQIRDALTGVISAALGLCHCVRRRCPAKRGENTEASASGGQPCREHSPLSFLGALNPWLG